jgi:GT2 family glycosyltransferase
MMNQAMHHAGSECATRIGVVMTCHNRRDTTLACLAHLNASSLPKGTAFELYLVDDGSSDGTADAVQSAFPAVHVLPGSGSLFWNGGMRMAFAAAMERDFDYYLWLNDDTMLYPDAIGRLLETANALTRGRPGIVVGPTQDPATGALSYGGYVRPHRLLKPITLRFVPPASQPMRCETLTGNCVLLSRAVVVSLGNLDPGFTHSMGDVDYGLRAHKAGFPIWIMPGFAGTCSDNPTFGTFADTSLSLTERMREILHPKGLPLREYKLLTKRHAGPGWFVYWLWPYLRTAISAAWRRPWTG